MAKKSFAQKITDLLKEGRSVEFIPVCGMETIYAYLDDEQTVYGFGTNIETALDMLHTLYFYNKKTLELD